MKKVELELTEGYEDESGAPVPGLGLDAAFPTATEKNPTLTILALSWRATDYLAEQMRQGNV